MHSDIRLFGYGGKNIKTIGVCELVCKHKDQTHHLEFHVCDEEATPILGLKSCIDMNVVKIIMSVEEDQNNSSEIKQLVNEYSDIFDGIGQFPGEYSFNLHPDAEPVVHPPRRVPMALRDKVKQELDRMVELDIIAKVTKPTDWVNSMVVVEKRNGDLRICLDPRDLNKAIKRPYYPVPTLDDVTGKLSGARHFSTLDDRSGYWEIKLSDESSRLTTFNSPFGRFRYLRMPFGINCAQDVFQRHVDETYENVPGVTGISDDVLVAGNTPEEHVQRLRTTFQRAREHGQRYNLEKCQFNLHEVKYYGHVISADGVKADPKKVEAITQMPPPQNKAELQTILGMVNYLAKFVPNLSDVTAQMRDLLKKDAEFVWDSQQDAAFESMKNIITQTPALAYYDPRKPLTLQVNASARATGAVLMQEGRPVEYASRALDASKQNWAPIEREMLAIVHGCERFRQYMYGRKTTVESDHKPLEAIMKKPLSAAPKRLQSMILELQRFRYDISIVHRPGKEIPVADCLSRNLSADNKPVNDEFSHRIDTAVHSLIATLPISGPKMEVIRAATSSDREMQVLKHVILSGWPSQRKECPEMIADHWNHRDELSVAHVSYSKGIV